MATLKIAKQLVVLLKLQKRKCFTALLSCGCCQNCFFLSLQLNNLLLSDPAEGLAKDGRDQRQSQETLGVHL